MIDKLNGDFLQWLRGFHHVVTLGSAAAAATAMGVRQPTVSHHIKMLETELGVQLFQRIQRRMQPTLEGLALYERAIVLFEQIRSIQDEVGRPREGALKGDISLITTHSVATNYLPSLIESFAAQHAGVAFTLTAVTGFAAILENVQNSSVELGITHGQLFPPVIGHAPLFSTKLVLIVSKKHAAERGWRFTRKQDGTLADFNELDNIPYVAFSPGTMLTHLLHELLARHNVRIRPVITVNTSSLLARYVARGFGVTIVDSFTAAASGEGYDSYCLQPDGPLRVYHAIYRKKTYMPPQTRAFIKHLQAARPDIEGIAPAPE